MLFEILFVENSTYHINYYEFGLECRAVKLKLEQSQFDKWKINKIEL